MTAAQHGRAEPNNIDAVRAFREGLRRNGVPSSTPVPSLDPDVREAVARFLRCNTDPAMRKKWRAGEAERLVDDLFRTVPALAVVGQASRADQSYDEGGIDALWGITAELMDHETLTVAQIRAEAERQRSDLAARSGDAQNQDGAR